MSAVKPTLPTPDSRRPLTPVELPAWGVTLYVRLLSAGDALRLPVEDQVLFTSLLILKSAAYEDGSRVWQDSDIDTLLGYPAEDLQPLMDAALRVNGITADAVQEAKGNSSGDPENSSSSESPENSEA